MKYLSAYSARTCCRCRSERMTRIEALAAHAAEEPLADRVRARDTDLGDAAACVLHDEEREDRSEPQVVDLEKVARPNLVALVGEKRRPFLAPRGDAG